MDIKFSVRPAKDVIPATNSASLSAEALYFLPPTDIEDDGSELVPQTERIVLDVSMQGTAVLLGAAGPQVQVNLLAVDGSLIFSRTVTADAAGNAALEVTREEIALCEVIRQKVPGDITPLVCTRTVQLVPTTDITVDYTRSSIVVCPLNDQVAVKTAGIDTLKIVTDKINSLDLTGQDLSPLTRITWIPAHLGVDGSFVCSFTQKAGIGWLWWLAGEHQVIGFIPDDLSQPGDRKLAIALPALSTRGDGVSNVQKEGCGCEKTVPQNVTEADLANNPAIFTEDPGSFCKPFSNPERVLSEKSFSVIARVTQPEIGASSSAKTKSLKLLTLDTEEASATSVTGTGTLRRIMSSVGLSRSVGIAASILPSRHVLPAAYKNFVMKLPSGRYLMSSKHPLQWEDDIAQYQTTSVALGHILEYRVRWRSNGYSLGTVVKTLTLAPRQTKRIQKIEWERSERARRTERTQLTDDENDSTVRERDYQDLVSAHLSEWARGASHSDTEAIAGGIGFFFSGVVGGVGGGAGSSNSSSHQEGGRDTTASEHQRLQDAIRRHGDALRKFESTVVNEVSQEETVTGTTEVIRNLNYAHSLTVIYYQILRHLKVNSEFAGVRECLFIPFAIKPFDVQRAYRWRESIQAAIRSRRFLRALRYLKDAVTNFATSDIPDGSRADQKITYLRGSIFVDLAVERPRDSTDGKYDDTFWNPFKRLLGIPALGIFNQLMQRAEVQREQFFQANFAPSMAAKWVNRLQLRLGSRTLNVDSSLATRYQFNSGVRIDFVVQADQLGGLKRSDVQNVTVVAADDLPPGSVANLTRMSITYSTAKFEHSVQGRTGVNDLIQPETGRRDSALVSFPLDSWEIVNERQEILRSVQDLVEHLNEHVEYYHKAIWWRMDRDRLMMMLDGFYVPNTNNVSIATVVDREPVGIIGNCLIYRVGAASYIGYGTINKPASLYNLYAEKQPVRDPILISLPTDGLYAQTIMDDCLALEEHYGNLDWALNDKDPELGTIDASLLTTRRADQTTATTPTQLPATIINLQNAPEAPAPSGLQGVLNAVTNPNAFRDMAGLAATQANAQAALNTAANLATNFGNQAAAVELAKTAKSQEATRTADQKLATIQRAKEKGLTSETEAAAQAKEVLTAMNPDLPKSNAPHENPAITSAINTARNIAGSTIEANTGEGAVKVSLGNDKTTLASFDKPLQQLCGFFGQNRAVTEADLRASVVQAAENERNNWFAAGAFSVETGNSQFGHLVRYWLGQTCNITPSQLTALQAQAIAAGFNYGALLTNNDPNADMSVTAAQVRAQFITAAGIATTPSLNSMVEQALLDARLSRLNTTPWSAVFVVSIVRSVAISQMLEAEVSGSHVGKDVLLKATSAHRIYAAAAYANRQAGKGGTYHAFEATTRTVQVGDIIVQDRRNNLALNNVWKFADLGQLATQGLETHGDIITSVDVANGHVTTIGGNLGQTVRRRRYPIDANAMLVVAGDRNYAQERDDGTMPVLPGPIAPPLPAQLDSQSTARIFALLSPVQDCIVLPGQQVGGGVLV